MRIKLKVISGLALCAATALPLAGCWDKVELESRGIVNAISVDKDTSSGDVKVAVALPNLAEIAAKNGAKQGPVQEGRGKTLLAAIRDADGKTNQKLFLGQMKAVIFGSDALKDESIMRSAIDTLRRSEEVNRKVLLFAADDQAEDILEAKLEGNPLIGTYFTTFYKNSSVSRGSYIKQDLQGAAEALESNGACLIPKIGAGEGFICPEGADLIKNYQYVDDLTMDQTDGVLLLQNKCVGMSDTAEIDGAFASLRIKSCVKHASFALDGQGKITYNLRLDIKGDVQEQDDENRQALKEAFQKNIAARITEVAGIFSRANADGFGLGQEMYKFANDLYENRASAAGFMEELTVVPSVSVEIGSNGMISR